MSRCSHLVLLLVLAASTASAAAAPAAALVRQEAGAFEKLHQEWNASYGSWKEQLRAAKKAGTKLSERPADPTPLFYPRYELLGQAGDGRAVLWMAEHLRDAFPLAESKEAAARLLTLVLAARDADWVAEVLEPLRQLRRVLDEERLTAGFEALLAEGRPVRLRMAAARALAAVVEPEDPARALALYAQGCALAQSPEALGAPQAIDGLLGVVQRVAAAPDAPLRVEAVARLRELALRWPDSAVAKRADDLVFRLEHLSVGCQAPDFESEDIDGNAFQLSDYEGKVTLIDFWGFW